jgi:hypothetical protein
MLLCCTEEFKQEVERLRKNSSYADIEQSISEFYCDATFDEASTGDILYPIPGMSFLKKRVEGRGGFRFYVLAVVKGEKIYLAYVHPKVGRYGMDNVSTEKKKLLLKEVLAAIKEQRLYKVERDDERPNRILFSAYLPQNHLHS